MMNKLIAWLVRNTPAVKMPEAQPVSRAGLYFPPRLYDWQSRLMFLFVFASFAKYRDGRAYSLRFKGPRGHDLVYSDVAYDNDYTKREWRLEHIPETANG